jgi:hypothetical protein
VAPALAALDQVVAIQRGVGVFRSHGLHLVPDTWLTLWSSHALRDTYSTSILPASQIP